MVKHLDSYWFKSVTTEGNLAKTYCDVYSNGVTTVKQIILSESDYIEDCVKVCRKFGKNLFVNYLSLKYSSLVTIAESTSHILNENKVKQTDLI